MSNLPKQILRWPATTLFIILPPVFYLAFTIVYNPFGSIEFLEMGRGIFPLNISILFAIMLLLLAGLRTALHFFINARRFTWAHYISWCLGELLLISLFSSMYVSLMSAGEYPYFDALFHYCLPQTFLILIYPYLILSLGFALNSSKSSEEDSAPDGSLIRFYDAYKKPKLLIAVNAILYIRAEENYVNIWYAENGRPVKYSLRATMNSIEETCARHGLIRCQRSFFVNPAHVTILRKENGWIYADLDIKELPSIPVSKRYYESLSSLL